MGDGKRETGNGKRETVVHTPDSGRKCYIHTYIHTGFLLFLYLLFSFLFMFMFIFFLFLSGTGDSIGWYIDRIEEEEEK